MVGIHLYSGDCLICGGSIFDLTPAGVETMNPAAPTFRLGSTWMRRRRSLSGMWCGHGVAKGIGVADAI